MKRSEGDVCFLMQAAFYFSLPFEFIFRISIAFDNYANEMRIDSV